MPTHKDLLLETLDEKGNMSKDDLLDAVLTKRDDAVRDSVRRRLDELVDSGRVLCDKKGRYSVGQSPLTGPQQVNYDLQIRKLKDENRNLKNKYRDALRYRDLSDALIDAYAEYGQRWEPVPIAQPVLKPDVVMHQTAVELMSDWHFWEVVDIRETRGLAEYNMDIASAYLQYYGDKALHIFHDVNKGIIYRTLYVLLLGDFVSTNIHDILAHSPGTAVDSLLEAQVQMGHYLLDQARHFDEVRVYGVVGNHGRLTQYKQYKKRYANWDYVLYNQLAMMLADQENISFCFPRSFFDLVDIEGHVFLIMHGDDIKSWNQIPWYGIDRAIRKFQELLNANGEDFEYVVMGHFHNTGALETCRGEKLINGSAIGTTDFSMGKLFTGNRPHQMILSVHEENGVTWRNPIRLRIPEDLRYTMNRSRQIHEEWKYVLEGAVAPVDPRYSDEYAWQETYTA